jgi:hypothetical protein
LTKEFSEQDTPSQKLEFAQLLSTAIDEVVSRLRNKRLVYDLGAMQADADRIVQAWAREFDEPGSAREAAAAPEAVNPWTP